MSRPRRSGTGPWSTGGVTTHPSREGDFDEPIDVLVVDGANVVGSRPDGWWRDRPAAAARLHSRLLDCPALAGQVVLVLEGRAKAGVPQSRTGAVQVVHAPGEGDDAIVGEVERVAGNCAPGPANPDSAGRTVAVVTADRALAARVAGVQGPRVRVLGPGWLLGRLG